MVRISLVLVSVFLTGCMRISVIGQECEETNFGFMEWDIYVHVSCKFPKTSEDTIHIHKGDYHPPEE